MGGTARSRGFSAVQRSAALLLVGLAAGAVAFPGCCPDCTSSCEGCPASTSYCLVIPGSDDGGSRVDAYCEPLPAACVNEPSCECLRVAQDTIQDRSVEPRTSTCEGDTKIGLTLSGCRGEICPGPIDAEGGECPPQCCCITWEPPA